MLRMLAFRPDGSDGAALSSDEQAAPADNAAGQKPAARPGRKPPVAPLPSAAAREAEPPPYGDAQPGPEPAGNASSGPDAGRLLQDWHAFVGRLGLKGMAAQLADNSVFDAWDGRRLSLRVDPACGSLIGSLAEARLQEAVSGMLDRPVTLQLVAEIAGEETPAQRDARDRQARQQAIEAEIAGDPLVLALQEAFDAEIVPDSIRHIQ